MAIFYPDNLQHNNPTKYLVDITEIRGNAYPIGVLAETGSIPEDKRNIGQIIFVSSSQEYYGYYGATTNSASWDDTNNWRPLSVSSGSFTGDFSGSFAGDGSQLTGIVSSKWSGSNPITRDSDVEITGSLRVTEGITGSLFGTASYAATASYVNTLNQDLIFNGNLTLNGTASISYLDVTIQSSSIIYSTGSNQFGDDASDTQTLYGSIIVPTGSLTISGSTILSGSLLVTDIINGSLFGTSSFANISEFAYTASVAPNYTLTSSFNEFTTSLSLLSSSFDNFILAYNTGSFSGSFIGDGSQLTGIVTSKWTSSLNGDISRESNVNITGSFNLKFDGISNYFAVSINDEDKIKINEEGIMQLMSQSMMPIAVPGGIFYSASNEFFIGLVD